MLPLGVAQVRTLAKRRPCKQECSNLRALGASAHQNFSISLHELLKDSSHLLSASCSFEISAARSIGFLKEVGKEGQRPGPI